MKLFNSMVLLLTFLSLFASHDVMASVDVRFACGGSVEAEVWEAWDTSVRSFLNQSQLGNRLLKQGDVYALYDFQTYTHNMVSMARRCDRLNRLTEVARLVRTAYGALEPGTQSLPGRRWVCRGGSICNNRNGLLNMEVMLDSAQFLGLASSVANALASSGAPLNKEDRVFISDTVQIVTEHVLRWGSDEAIDWLLKSAYAKPQDVRNGSTGLFFSDKPLWLITIYAELAGILQAQERQRLDFVELTNDNKTRMRQHFSALLQLFSARLSFQRNSNGRLRNVDLADLDRGYWRLYTDNRYAGYEDNMKPVECLPLKNDETRFSMEVRVSADVVQKRQDTGWDISHARRLVHALDALERNRAALKYVLSLDDGQLPATGLTSAFANTLVAVLWNGDTNKPLFSNYWSGANGWFRVAYDNGTGQCREGYPPYGMADAFPTGGYITWARYNPTIGLLGQRLYDLTSSPSGEDSPFVAKYYTSLSRLTSAQNRMLSRFMFLPSLVGVNIK